MLLTSLFASFNFLYFFLHQLAITILLSHIEGAIGSSRTALIYIGSGMMGGLFGAMIHCCTETPYLENEAAIYGMIGSLIGVI